MKRKNEVTFSTIGLVGGLGVGAQIGSHILLAFGNKLIWGIVPCAIIGGALLGLLGNRFGYQCDQNEHLACTPQETH